MVEKTLDAMVRGGKYDHIGYGFSRYTVENFNGLEWFDDCCSCKSWEDFRQLRDI
jgi:hypothetical protein